MPQFGVYNFPDTTTDIEHKNATLNALNEEAAQRNAQTQLIQQQLEDHQAARKQQASTQAILSGQGQAAPSLLQQATPQAGGGQITQPTPQVDQEQQLNAKLQDIHAKQQIANKLGNMDAVKILDGMEENTTKQLNTYLDEQLKQTKNMVQHIKDTLGAIHGDGSLLGMSRGQAELNAAWENAGPTARQHWESINPQTGKPFVSHIYSPTDQAQYDAAGNLATTKMQRIEEEQALRDSQNKSDKLAAETKTAQNNAIITNQEAINMREFNRKEAPAPEDPSKIMEYYDKREAMLNEKHDNNIAKLTEKYSALSDVPRTQKVLDGNAPYIHFVDTPSPKEKAIAEGTAAQEAARSASLAALDVARQKALSGRTITGVSQGGKIVDQATLQAYATKHGIPIDKAIEFLKGQGYGFK